MKLATLVAGAIVILGLAVPVAGAQPSPSAWQPVVSDSAGAIGRVITITQPASVSGVVALVPTTNIPAAGSGTLAWNASGDTLSWRGGPAVAVNMSISTTYALPEPSAGAKLIVTVRPAELPSGNASDVLSVTSASARAGFGNDARDTARGSAVFKGDVYLGLGVRGAQIGEVWRSADGIDWVLAALPNFGLPAGAILHVDSFIVFDGQLYAGTDQGQVWRTSDGSLWTLASPTPGYDNNITDFAIFDNVLYANQANSGPGGVFRSPDGTSWVNVLQFPESQLEYTYTHDLQVFGGSLFSSVGNYGDNAGSGPGAIWSSLDGTHWNESGADGFGDANNTDISGLAVFGGDLYAGTFNATEGAQVWRTSDGESWNLVASNGFGDPDNTIVHELIVFDGELYAGTENDHEGGEIWRTADGTTWSLANVPGFGTGEYQRIRSFFELGGYLYANGENDCRTNPLPGCTEHGWEIWRLAPRPPTCAVAAIRRAGAEGSDQEDVTVQAPGGLASISHVDIANGTVAWPEDAGTTEQLLVTATKSTQGVTTTWSFDATDQTGQTTHCG